MCTSESYSLKDEETRLKRRDRQRPRPRCTHLCYLIILRIPTRVYSCNPDLVDYTDTGCSFSHGILAFSLSLSFHVSLSVNRFYTLQFNVRDMFMKQMQMNVPSKRSKVIFVAHSIARGRDFRYSQRCMADGLKIRMEPPCVCITW